MSMPWMLMPKATFTNTKAKPAFRSGIKSGGQRTALAEAKAKQAADDAEDGP